MRSLLVLAMLVTSLTVAGCDGTAGDVSDSADPTAAVTPADEVVFLPHAPSYGPGEPYRQLEMESGETVTIRHVESPGASYTVLYSHGNGEDLGDLDPVLQEWQARGYSVVAWDYAGYGQSTGRPTERAIVENIRRVYQYMTDEAGIPPKSILVYGWSLGGYPSLRLALEKPVAGLILDSTFTTAADVWTQLPKQPTYFDNLGRIDKVPCPVLVIHGDADEIVPYPQGQQLYERAPEPKLWLGVQGASHGEAMWIASPEYWDRIEELTRLAERSQR